MFDAGAELRAPGLELVEERSADLTNVDFGETKAAAANHCGQNR
jgi:hypothetical protein